MKRVRFETSCGVGTEAVSLTITIGNAQMGASRVLLEAKELGIGAISNLPIGKGPSLVGKTLRVKTVVTDVNDRTNLTNVRYTFKGLKGNNQYDLQAMVDEQGDSVIYHATFNFV